MGEYKQSVNWHYSKGNISALIGIANDKTIDEDDRELANKLIKKLKNQSNNSKSAEKEIEK